MLCSTGQLWDHSWKSWRPQPANASVHALQAKMGVTVKVLDPTPGCPASAVAEQVVGSFRDPAAVQQLARDVDVLTVEIEHVDADALEAVGLELDIDVEPTPHTLRLIQVKLVSWGPGAVSTEHTGVDARVIEC